MKRFTGILFFLLLSMATFAQQKAEKPLVQFSGIVHNAEKKEDIVPNVTVTNVSYHNQANAANYKGYFSFVVHEQDTLRFTSVGYAPQTVVVPTGIKNGSYTLLVDMKPQVINLPMFRVFPWATTEEFRKDFLAIKLADDDLALAYKNLSRNNIAASLRSTARDPDEIRSADVQDLHNRIQNSHSLIPNPLLNPVAWGSLIKQIADGDKSRKSND
ncbi:hypothetical protein GCM10027037_26310 [Mucilaginibacter koreensis]